MPYQSPEFRQGCEPGPSGYFPGATAPSRIAVAGSRT